MNKLHKFLIDITTFSCVAHKRCRATKNYYMNEKEKIVSNTMLFLIFGLYPLGFILMNCFFMIQQDWSKALLWIASICALAFSVTYGLKKIGFFNASKNITVLPPNDINRMSLIKESNNSEKELMFTMGNHKK